MSTEKESQFPVFLGLTDVPQASACTHLGIQYPGEVIVADRWRAEWGAPLKGNVYFRVVLLRSRQSIPRDAIQDSRIAACVPGGAPERQRKKLDSELRTIREVRAQYGASSDLRRSVVHQALERREEEVQDLLEVAQAQRYREGVIHSPTAAAALSPGEVFRGDHPEDWCLKIAEVLLSWAYPTLPLNPSLLPRTLRPEDAARVFEAIWDPAISEGSALAQLGPGLGLSTTEEPHRYNPEDCAAFRRIDQALETAGGQLPWDQIHRVLAHADGLTAPLATMYLLAIVLRGRPEVEIGLRRGHGLRLKDGQPLLSDRLIRDVFPVVGWQEDISDKFTNLRRPTPITWNGALPYTSRLVPELQGIEDEDVPTAQQEALVQGLSDLSGRLNRCQRIVEDLSQLSDAPNGKETLAILENLSHLSGSQDFTEVYHRARRHFDSPAALSGQMLLLGRIEALEESMPDLRWAMGYLNEAVVQGSQQRLSLARMALMSQLSLPHLLREDMTWRSFEGQFERFRQDYAQAYLNHHREYHSNRAGLSAYLGDGALQLAALGHLNSILELGEPVGQELGELYQLLKEAVKVCDLVPDELNLDLRPRCHSCALVLEEELPSREVERFHKELERSLLEQNRRLSHVLVDRILHGRSDKRLEDFLKIVQASDLSSLANTLDDEMVGFIRRLVSAQ